MEIVSHAELMGRYSSAYAVLKSHHLYDIKNSLVCSTGVEYCQTPSDKLILFYVFASDGYLYQLDGIDSDFSLRRVTDTCLYKILRSQAHDLGNEYPIINFALLNFERKAKEKVKPI